MKIKILTHTPQPEKVIATAAKLCYSNAEIENIEKELTDPEIEKFLNNLIKIGHESPFEHSSFTFAAEGISRACTHQLVRHRIASFSQQSQRYVKLDQFDYIVPPEIESIPEAKEIFINAMKQDQDNYNKLVDLLYSKHFLYYINFVDEKKALSLAEKKAIEDARYIFPNACESKIIFTMNVRSLYNFLGVRCCNRAQWEIKSMADSMLKECKKISPILFKNAGKPCNFGECKEGSMSCKLFERA